LKTRAAAIRTSVRCSCPCFSVSQIWGPDQQCVGVIDICVHEPQHAAHDSSFSYNIWCAEFYLRHTVRLSTKFLSTKLLTPILAPHSFHSSPPRQRGDRPRVYKNLLPTIPSSHSVCAYNRSTIFQARNDCSREPRAQLAAGRQMVLAASCDLRMQIIS
jgi:hypothetical protein